MFFVVCGFFLQYIYFLKLSAYSVPKAPAAEVESIHALLCEGTYCSRRLAVAYAQIHCIDCFSGQVP